MAGELNTDVVDDSASCRATAEWLQTAASEVKALGDEVYRERSDSEWFWQSEAGDACRLQLTDEGHDCDTSERLITEVEHALRTFAAEIDSVQEIMNAARQDAAASGLLVTPNAILPPGPAPAAPPPPLGQPKTPQHQHAADTHRYQTAVTAYDAKQDAFQRVQAEVKQARDSQKAAHQALEQAMIDPLAEIKTLKTWAVYIIGSGLTWVKSTNAAARELLEKSDDLRTHSNQMQAIAEDPNLPERSRIAATRSAAASTQGAEETMKEYDKVLGPARNIPEGVRSVIEANPSG
jgi:hypothetical protein